MRTKLAAGITAISAVTVIGGTAIAAASAGPGGARAERLRIMNTVATSSRLSVIATGAFTAGGYVIPAKVTETVVFPAGTFRLRRHVQRFSGGGNPGACLITEHLRGTFTISDGTGRYAGIRGSGTFVTGIVAVTARNHAGQCTHAAAPATYQEITTDSGTISR